MKAFNDLITIQDIAEKAGISIGTVDRVIHNRVGVSEKTRQRVLEILKEYNYKPNLIARKSAGEKIFKIAALHPSSSTAFWAIHPEGIKRAAEELKAFDVIVDSFTFEFYNREEYASQLEVIRKNAYDAILTAPIYYEEIVKFLEETHIPSVFFDTSIQTNDKINVRFIGENAYQTGMVGGKLLSPGIKEGDSVLIISSGWVERETGVMDYFAQEFFAGRSFLPKFPKIQLLDFDHDSVRRKIQDAFAENPGISRVFINSCRATALCAPYLGIEKQKKKDLRIVGYDLTDENIMYLKNGVIDYLINKHPREQCYHGIKMLYELLVLRIPIPPMTYMPIDIIIRENVDYYKMLKINSLRS